MQNNFQACLDEVLKLEGGWVDDPADPGGATNLGVTLNTWRTWVGVNKAVTVADIKALTPADVAPLYQQVFWKGCAGEYLPAGADLATFDWCVNSGVRRGNQGLQEALGVSQDGLVGPETLKAAAAMGDKVLVNAICDKRAAFYEAQPEGEKEEFLDGWLNRVEAVRGVALGMIANA
jgi:lysozyme family protein